jgi:hypothetical protein
MDDTKTKTTNIRYLCENLHGTTFASPDGKWLIHVDYETVSEENHRRDEFNKDHIDHYFKTTDKIKSVSMEAV